MKIVRAKPPIFERALEVFPMASKPGVMFTYGDTIYVPNGADVSPELKAHEGVHFGRQTRAGWSPDKWWDQYLIDPVFRLEEEAMAYRAQAKTFKANHRDRNAYIRYAHALANILAGGLYGRDLITPSDARRLILS